MVLTVLALAYAVMVPYGEGPDEDAHLCFVRTLAGEVPAAGGWAWGLPVLAVAPDDANFEVHQPPLYYGLATVCYRLAGLAGVRALNWLCTVALVLVTWRGLRELFDDDVAVAAAAVVALLPMQAFMAMRVNNDSLVNLLWAMVLWRWLHNLREGPSLRDGLWTGGLIGAALLTKQTSVALLPLVVLAAGLVGLLSRRWAETLAWLAATLAVAAGVAGWWYLRNCAVYGDPLAQRVFDLRFLATRATRATLSAEFAQRPDWSYWPYVFEWTVRTSVIYIGHQFFRLPRDVYPYHLAWLAATSAAGVAAVARRATRRVWDARLAATVLMACGLAGLVVLLVRFNAVYFQGQGRYLFPLLPAWALWLAGGPSRLFAPGSAGRRYGLLVAPLWLGLLNLLLLTAFVPGLCEPR